MLRTLFLCALTFPVRDAQSLQSWHPKQFRKHSIAKTADGAENKQISLEPVLTPVGSPTLAGESLAPAVVDVSTQSGNGERATVEQGEKVGEYPHFEQCRNCTLCAADQLEPSFHTSLAEIQPTHDTCPVCRGCTHHIERINTQPKVAGTAVKMATGNTGASIYTTPTNRTTNGIAVIKVHGVKSDMVAVSKVPQMMRLYHNSYYKSDERKMVNALMKLQHDCGLDHINIQEWIEPLRAVVPGLSQRLEIKESIFAEFAEGASLEVLTGKLTDEKLFKLLQRVPHEAIYNAALFDTLFVQGDRHGENLFITDEGGFKLIDTRDTTLTFMDSLFLPGTYFMERNRIGNEAMHAKVPPPPGPPKRRDHWLQLTLDYRCHVPGGAIGFNYPPKVHQCLASMQNASAEELMARYGLPGLSHGKRLQLAARTLHDEGFEAALHAIPKKKVIKDQPPNGFPWQEPCCDIAFK
eukprot:gene15808-18746_t